MRPITKDAVKMVGPNTEPDQVENEVPAVISGTTFES